METLWTQRTTIRKRPALKEKIDADVCVIGAGMAGLCCAIQLQQAKKKVVVLEAARIAGGQTAKTTAKITMQMGCFFSELLEKQGLEKAQAVVSLYNRSLTEFETIVRQKHIDCQFERLPAVLTTKKEPEKLKKEAQAARQLGIEASFFETMETPDGIAAAVRFEHQAQFDPLRFAAALAEELTIYEQSAAVRVLDQTVFTALGSVRANWIIFATHFPIINVPGFYFMKMHQERSNVLALKSVQNRHALFYGIDEDGFSFRWDRGVLLMGGAAYRTGKNTAGGQMEKLRRKAAELFPEGKEMLAWSAQDCMTLDGLPYIGQYCCDRQHWLVATGFNKWGMLHSMAAALLLKERIFGEDDLAAAVFDSLRTMLSEPVELVKEGIQAADGLMKTVFDWPKITAMQLEAGHGGMVELNGEKIGVYKDDSGDLYAVSLRCPHLGCQLTWNPDEKSWDCPCHGSRFNYRGRLIDGPAQEDLKAKCYPKSEE